VALPALVLAGAARTEDPPLGLPASVLAVARAASKPQSMHWLVTRPQPVVKTESTPRSQN
jgi:hypothetical protein